MSLLRRTEAHASTSQNQSNNQQNQNNNTRSNPFSGRFGSNNQNNTNQQNNNPRQPPPPVDVKVETTTIPVRKELVRFSLSGLGDPFYHVLGYPVNTLYSKLSELISALETDNKQTQALTDALEDAWKGYNLQGGALVYHYVQDALTAARTPSIMPGNDDFFEEEDDKKDEEPYVAYTLIRAMDIRLVINVLARARTQILIANAPLLLNGMYLGRNLVTDDPRLVELAKATSYVSDGGSV